MQHSLWKWPILARLIARYAVEGKTSAAYLPENGWHSTRAVDHDA